VKCLTKSELSQVFDTNLTSLPEVMVLENPCNLTIAHTYTIAKILAEWMARVGMK
jgi:hypothetical protein